MADRVPVLPAADVSDAPCGEWLRQVGSGQGYVDIEILPHLSSWSSAAPLVGIAPFHGIEYMEVLNPDPYTFRLYCGNGGVHVVTVGYGEACATLQVDIAI